MTEKTPPTGPDVPGDVPTDGASQALHAQAARTGRPVHELAAESAQRAVQARKSEGQEVTAENRPDETRDETRLCEFCQQELPEQTGVGPRQRYHPKGTGPFENVPDAGECKVLARAQRAMRAVRGTDSVPGASEVALGEDVASMRDLLDRFTHRAGEIRGNLTTVGTQLDERVATMRIERDNAVDAARDAQAQATEDRRLRKVAEDNQAEAVHARNEAQRRAAAAQREVEAARHDKLIAEREQARVEGVNTQLVEQARQAALAAARDRERAETAEQANTRLDTAVEQLTRQLSAAIDSAEHDRVRADRAVQEATTLRDATAQQIAAIQDHAAQQIDAARTAADQRVTAAHAETTRILLEHGEELRRIDRERSADRAAWERRIAAAQQALDQAKRAVQLLLRTEPDRDTASPASEQRLRTELTSLIQEWPTPSVDDRQ